METSPPTKRRALISVSDKTGLIPLAQRLHSMGFELVSTSGTARTIKEAGLPCTLVEDITGFPEMLNGRVRTLHPKIFGGIIADQFNVEHMQTLDIHGIDLFHVIVVNLYPFSSKPSIENIDVGGPSMIRAAAKNYQSQIVVVDPGDYQIVTDKIEEDGVDTRTRLMLAAKAFKLTAEYDDMIRVFLAHHVSAGTEPPQGDKH